MLYRKQNNFVAALEVTQKALNYFIPKQDSGYVMLSYENMANYELDMGNADKSVEYDFIALDYARQLDDHVTEHRVLHNIAHAYLFKKDYKNARNYLNKALENWKPEDWLDLSESMWNLSALIDIEQGMLKSARVKLDSSKIYTERYLLNQYGDLKAEAEVKYFAQLGDYTKFTKALDDYRASLEDKFNSQRQKTFEEMLVQDDKLSIDEVLDRSVFNSRTTFYRIFSDFTSLKPSEFIEEHKKRKLTA